MEGKFEEIWQTINTPRTHEERKRKERKREDKPRIDGLFHPSNRHPGGGRVQECEGRSTAEDRSTPESSPAKFQNAEVTEESASFRNGKKSFT